MTAKAGASVMVVEDQGVIATWLQLRLERLGYAVLDTASDAEDALAKASMLHPQVVLMDVHLGGGSDGIVAAQQIRERHGIPVILVTGFVDDDTLRRAREARVDGFIQKPFDERQLHTAIQTALCKRRLEIEQGPSAAAAEAPQAAEWPVRALLHRLNNELAVATALLEMLQEEQVFPAASQKQMRSVQERLAAAGQITSQLQHAIRKPNAHEAAPNDAPPDMATAPAAEAVAVG